MSRKARPVRDEVTGFKARCLRFDPACRIESKDAVGAPVYRVVKEWPQGQSPSILCLWQASPSMAWRAALTRLRLANGLPIEPTPERI